MGFDKADWTTPLSKLASQNRILRNTTWDSLESKQQGSHLQGEKSLCKSPLWQTCTPIQLYLTDSFLAVISDLNLRFITAARKIRAEILVCELHKHLTEKAAIYRSTENVHRDSYACLMSLMSFIKQHLAERNPCWDNPFALLLENWQKKEA